MFPGVILRKEIESVAGRGVHFLSEAVILLLLGCMENAAKFLRGWREVLRLASSREVRVRQDIFGVVEKDGLACGKRGVCS